VSRILRREPAATVIQASPSSRRGDLGWAFRKGGRLLAVGLRFRGRSRFSEPVERKVQQATPVLIFDAGPGDLARYWLFNGQVWSTIEELTADEVRALIDEQANRVRARVARAVALQEQESAVTSPRSREPIRDDVKVLVWRRDGGRCVRCGSNRDLEFDHIIPVSMGGSNTARNLQLLCEGCNRAKAGSLA
jgi:hypothetical protein